MCRRSAHAGVASAQRLPKNRHEIDHRDPRELRGKPIENVIEPLPAAHKPREMRKALPMNS